MGSIGSLRCENVGLRGTQFVVAVMVVASEEYNSSAAIVMADKGIRDKGRQNVQWAEGRYMTAILQLLFVAHSSSFTGPSRRCQLKRLPSFGEK